MEGSSSWTIRIPADLDTTHPVTISGADQAVAAWVASRLGLGAEGFGHCRATGVLYGESLIAGVVYHRAHHHAETGLWTLEASIAADSPRFATRKVLRDLFAYPFETLQAARLAVQLAKDNRRGRDFVVRLGFVYEGKGRKAWDGVRDAVVYSMLPNECRWL